MYLRVLIYHLLSGYYLSCVQNFAILYAAYYFSCWMKPEPLYYSFLLPIGCIILANIVLFSLILRGLTCARPTQLRTNRSEAELRMMYFKAGVAVFTLLGK